MVLAIKSSKKKYFLMIRFQESIIWLMIKMQRELIGIYEYSRVGLESNIFVELGLKGLKAVGFGKEWSSKKIV